MRFTTILTALLPGAFALLLLLLSVSFADPAADTPPPPAPEKSKVAATSAEITALKKDVRAHPDDPAPHLKYGRRLLTHGQTLREIGETQAAGKYLSDAELHLQRAIELFGDQPENSVQRAQCYFLLGELSFRGCNDPAQAVDLYSKALEIDSQLRAAKDALKAASAAPSVAAADAGAGADAAATPPRRPKARVQTKTVGSRGVTAPHTTDRLGPRRTMPKNLSFNGKPLLLVHHSEDNIGPVWAYVPETEKLNQWTEMAVVRRHKNYQKPAQLAQQTAEATHARGGTVVTMETTDTEGRLILVNHSAVVKQSEVNIVHTFSEEGTLMAEHYARRFQGDSHKEDSLDAAKSSGPAWLTLLLEKPLGTQAR